MTDSPSDLHVDDRAQPAEFGMGCGVTYPATEQRAPRVVRRLHHRGARPILSLLPGQPTDGRLLADQALPARGSHEPPTRHGHAKTSARRGNQSQLVVEPLQFTPFTALLLAHVFAEVGLRAGADSVVPQSSPSATVEDPPPPRPRLRQLPFTRSMKVSNSVPRRSDDRLPRESLGWGEDSPCFLFDDVERRLHWNVGAPFGGDKQSGLSPDGAAHGLDEGQKAQCAGRQDPRRIA